MEIREEYQFAFDIVNQIISRTNELLLDSSYQDKTTLEDIVLTEMNDLLFGIEQGQIYLSDTKYLKSTRYTKSGTIQDKNLSTLIFTLQEEFHKNKHVKKHDTGRRLESILDGALGAVLCPIIVFAALGIFVAPIFWLWFTVSTILLGAIIVTRRFNAKKKMRWNYQLYPNLPYQNCKSVTLVGYKDEDIMVIQYDHVAIDLGYIEADDKYRITVLKKDVQPSKSIIEEIEIEKSYLVERALLDVMKKYQKN